MRVLFISGTPHLPQVCGGVEVNVHELALELARRGAEPMALARLSLRDPFGVGRGLRAIAGRGPVPDTGLGYPVYRVRNVAQGAAIVPKPDIAVIVNGIPLFVVRALKARGVPVLFHIHGLGFEEWSERTPEAHPTRVPIDRYLSNSRFTASRFRAYAGIETEVIPPVFRRERYEGPRSGTNATLINPVAVKGIELTLAIAERCPEIQFTLAKGWPLRVSEARKLKAAVSVLPNVTHAGFPAMRDVYARTRVLLVPSQMESETWGRVASEAQYSGIPVLGSNRGGLPEAIGPGGTILPHDADPDLWAAELRRLFTDTTYYEEKSAAALAHSRRPEIDLDHQMRAFIRVLEETIAEARRGARKAPPAAPEIQTLAPAI